MFFIVAYSIAKATKETEAGFEEASSEESTGRIPETHTMSSRAGNLIREFVSAIEYGADTEDKARTRPSDSSWSECLKKTRLIAYFEMSDEGHRIGKKRIASEVVK